MSEDPRRVAWPLKVTCRFATDVFRDFAARNPSSRQYAPM